MSGGPITDRHRRPPENGARWVDYIPTWARVVFPAGVFVIALAGFALGFGRGQGEAAERVSTLIDRTSRLERLRDEDRELVAAIKEQLAEMRSEVRSIARALRVPVDPIKGAPEPEVKP